MSLRHGARQLIERLEAEEALALQLLDVAVERIKYNPDYATAQIRKAQDAIRRAAKRRDEELPSMLQKAAPPLERRIVELEQELHRVGARVDRIEGAGKVLTLTRRRVRR
jgi:hypothetical protein